MSETGVTYEHKKALIIVELEKARREVQNALELINKDRSGGEFQIFNGAKVCKEMIENLIDKVQKEYDTNSELHYAKLRLQQRLVQYTEGHGCMDSSFAKDLKMVLDELSRLEKG